MMHLLRKGRRLRIVLGVMATAIWWTCAAYGQTVPVVLTWSEEPQTTVTVFWQRSAPGRGTVRYGLTTNYTHNACDGGGTRRHRVTLRDLTPGTLYHYEAASTDGFTAGDRSFRTASGPTGSVNLVVHGDLHGGYSAEWSRSVAEAIRDAGPDLVIHMGDLSNQHDTPGFSTWGDFFNVTTDELDRVVFMPAPGNHDDPGYGSAYFWQFFSLPTRPVSGNPSSYRAGSVHFQVLDSDAGVEAQTNWMMCDLQAAAYDTNVAWIVPYFHRPPYSWGERAGDDFIKTNWARLFTMYEADLVFSGHSHNYQRTVPIRGVTYVVAGGGGATLYTSAFTPGSHEYATTCYHFVSVQVTGRVMRYRAIRSDGLVFEDLAITNARRKVRVDPAFPVRGATAKILYDAAQGPLFYSSPVYLYLGVDAFTGALVNAAMTYNAGSGLWEYDYVVPAATSNRIAFVFHDSASTNWDNNYTYNWQALLDDMPYVPDATPDPRLVVAGSPVITTNPAAQNNPGDNFDFVTNGAPLEARDTSGFGNFGQLYFNYD
ncbi:MAG: metallophosphoesterase, partial [Verrucomicrobia bacterium]|nr:metallophosphoesterase [Verrucomicrobiota bacterium]